MIQILQRALNAGVAPPRVLRSHPHDEATDLRECIGPSRTTFRVRPFLGDELPVPPKNGRHVRQDPTTQTRAQDGQPSPVIVRQPQTLMPQLHLQDAVLFAEVLDDVVLFPLEPAEK